MAVLKESWLSRRCSERLMSADREKSAPWVAAAATADDLLRCRRRSALRLRRQDPLPGRDPAWKWRAILHSSPDFQVVGEDVVFSDSKTSMCGRADMVVVHSGQKVLVRFWRGPLERATRLQVADMVLLMYLSGVWSGLIVRHDGDEARVDFVNPDRADARKMVEEMHRRSRELVLLVASSSTPPGEPGKDCHGCPYGEGCVERRAEEGPSGPQG